MIKRKRETNLKRTRCCGQRKILKNKCTGQHNREREKIKRVGGEEKEKLKESHMVMGEVSP